MIILAPGVQLNEEAHEYWYQGKQLSGVTGIVSENSGYGKMTDSMKNTLEETSWEGLHVHKSVEEWIKSGFKTWNTIHPAAVWVRDTILDLGYDYIQSETLVSDFKTYASAIDVMAKVKGRQLHIFDIKRKFKREYVEKQLSIYKYLVDKHSAYKVVKMSCFGTKDRRLYDIDFIGEKEVEKLLYAKTKSGK